MAKLTVIKSGSSPKGGAWAFVKQNYEGLVRTALINTEKLIKSGEVIELGDKVAKKLNWKYGG